MVNIPPDRPQKSKDAQEFGAYSLAIMVHNAEVNPGDVIRLEVYVTGYGRIRGAKFAFTPPPNFIEQEASKVIYGVEENKHGKATPTDAVRWGGTKMGLLEESGFVYQFGGLHGYTAWDGTYTHWGDEATSFWDVKDPHKDQTPMIATEKPRGRAPLELYLKTIKPQRWKKVLFGQDISGFRPGTHSFQGHLTYFNGDQWKSASQSVSVVVPNFFRRHEGLTWLAGTAGVLFAVGSLSLNIADRWEMIVPFFGRLGDLLWRF